MVEVTEDRDESKDNVEESIVVEWKKIDRSAYAETPHAIITNQETTINAGVKSRDRVCSRRQMQCAYIPTLELILNRQVTSNE